MKNFIFIIFTLFFSTSYACENAGEIDITKQCTFKYLTMPSGELLNYIKIAITKNQVTTAAGDNDGMKQIAVSADVEFKDGSTKKFSGNLPGVMLSGGNLLAPGASLQEYIDEEIRLSQGENPKVIDCRIFY